MKVGESDRTVFPKQKTRPVRPTSGQQGNVLLAMAGALLMAVFGKLREADSPGTQVSRKKNKQSLRAEGELMNWERVQQLVEMQISYWRAVGKQDWAQALEECLAKAERCQSMRDVVLDLRQRLGEEERSAFRRQE